MENFWKYNEKFLDKERTVRIDACNAKNTCPPKVIKGVLAAGNLQSLMQARTAHAVSYSKPFIDALRKRLQKDICIGG